MTDLFSLGLTYWPRRAGMGWWSSVDPGELQDDLATIADLGFDTLRLLLTWEEFQPGARQIGSRAMRSLEMALDAARSAGLQVVLTLFPVAAHDTLMLPDWANGASLIDELTGAGGLAPTLVVPAPGSAPVLYDGTYHVNQARDLFSYRPILAAQRYLIDEVVGYFGSHPAIWAWQLGEGLERIHRPASAEDVRAWYSTMADAVREHRTSGSILGVTSLRGLGMKVGPRPEELRDTCDLLGITADPPEPPGSPKRHTTFAAFAHAVAAGFAERPAIVTSLAMPTTEQRGGLWAAEQIYGRERQIFYADLEQHATFIETALNRLQADGAAGVWLAAYADHHTGRWREPPLDRAPRQRTLGIIDSQGRPKPAAEVVADFARRLRADDRRRASTLPGAIDPERYWHDPRQALKELWNDFESER
jgi:hypothetical protein